LQFKPSAIAGRHIAEQNRPAIAQLTGPVAELVARIHGSQWQRAGGDGVAGKLCDKGRIVRARRIQTDQRRRRVADADQIRLRQWRWLQTSIESRRQACKRIVER